jgi:hypothetical protein
VRLVILAVVPSLVLLHAGLVQGAPTPPSLKVTGVPKTAKPAQTLMIKASGYAGKFDTVSLYVAKDKCAGTESAEAKTHSGMSHSYGRAFFYVKPNKSYNGSRALVVNGKPGDTGHACVYLFQKAHTKAADQLHRAKSFKLKSG